MADDVLVRVDLLRFEDVWYVGGLKSIHGDVAHRIRVLEPSLPDQLFADWMSQNLAYMMRDAPQGRKVVRFSPETLPAGQYVQSATRFDGDVHYVTFKVEGRVVSDLLHERWNQGGVSPQRSRGLAAQVLEHVLLPVLNLSTASQGLQATKRRRQLAGTARVLLNSTQQCDHAIAQVLHGIETRQVPSSHVPESRLPSIVAPSLSHLTKDARLHLSRQGLGAAWHINTFSFQNAHFAHRVFSTGDKLVFDGAYPEVDAKLATLTQRSPFYGAQASHIAGQTAHCATTDAYTLQCTTMDGASQSAALTLHGAERLPEVLLTYGPWYAMEAEAARLSSLSMLTWVQSALDAATHLLTEIAKGLTAGNTLTREYSDALRFTYHRCVEQLSVSLRDA